MLHMTRFGNHERHAHPTDCKLFYTCLYTQPTGQEIKGSCETQGEKVFNEKTGSCVDPALVPGCEEYYKQDE